MRIYLRREARDEDGPDLEAAVTGGVGDCIVVARFLRNQLWQTSFPSTPRRNACRS
jgi:hypothetical protein